PGGRRAEAARGPLRDGEGACSGVRSKAKEGGIAPEGIGMVGFSAGGPLTIATATSFDIRAYEPIDEIDRVSCRPDFAVLVYPGYLKDKAKDELAPVLRIPNGTPPVFLPHRGAAPSHPPARHPRISPL